MKLIIFYFSLICVFFLISNPIKAQQLHHQMISSQGATIKTTSGLVVKQTIGQQSVTGNSQGEITVQQGYQQSHWETLLRKSKKSDVLITIFPNPFREILNFQFSSTQDSPVRISIFDSHGRIVFDKSSAAVDKIISLDDLPELPSAQYLVKLSNKNLNFHTIIIKI
jgi:preprotein translocase subunit YajC